MFRHILIPTDGSAASETAALAALRLARDCGAAVTALHVLADFHVITGNTAMLEETRATYEHDSLLHGGAVLGFVADNAREQHVPCETILCRSNQPYSKILNIAAERGCDLIAMATHGHFGLKGVLLGSETHKVLVHSAIPVLVFRAE